MQSKLIRTLYHVGRHSLVRVSTQNDNTSSHDASKLYSLLQTKMQHFSKISRRIAIFTLDDIQIFDLHSEKPILVLNIANVVQVCFRSELQLVFTHLKYKKYVTCVWDLERNIQ